MSWRARARWRGPNRPTETPSITAATWLTCFITCECVFLTFSSVLFDSETELLWSVLANWVFRQAHARANGGICASPLIQTIPRGSGIMSCIPQTAPQSGRAIIDAIWREQKEQPQCVLGSQVIYSYPLIFLNSQQKLLHPLMFLCLTVILFVFFFFFHCSGLLLQESNKFSEALHYYKLAIGSRPTLACKYSSSFYWQSPALVVVAFSPCPGNSEHGLRLCGGKKRRWQRAAGIQLI